MNWLEACRERKIRKLLRRQLEALHARILRARARQMLREAAVLRTKSPDPARMREVDRIIDARRKETVDASHRFSSECEQVAEFRVDVEQLRICHNVSYFRGFYGLGDPTWADRIAAANESPEWAIQIFHALTALIKEKDSGLFSIEQRQIREAIHVLKRRLRSHQAALRAQERERKQDNYEAGARAEDSRKKGSSAHLATFPNFPKIQ